MSGALADIMEIMLQKPLIRAYGVNIFRGITTRDQRRDTVRRLFAPHADKHMKIERETYTIPALFRKIYGEELQ